MLVIVNFNFQNKLVSSVKATFLTLLIFFITGCADKKSYLSEIPDIEFFTIKPISAFDISKVEVFDAQDWPFVKDTSNYFSSIGDIKLVTKNKIWISDPISGVVAEYDSTGKKIRIILDSGRGPNEVEKPSSIIKTNNSYNQFYHIYDVGQKTLIKIDTSGLEHSRFNSSLLGINGLENKIILKENNRILTSSLLYPEYSLIELDSVGNFSKGIVKKIIPDGFQPMTHNNIIFEFSRTNKKLVYAYSGIPIIFINDQKNQIGIDLEPKKQLSEINTLLKKLPQNKQITVKKLIKNILIDETNNQLIVSYLNDILFIDLEKNKIYLYSFFNRNKEKIKFHTFKKVGDKIFLINFFTGNIKCISLSALKKSNNT